MKQHCIYLFDSLLTAAFACRRERALRVVAMMMIGAISVASCSSSGSGGQPATPQVDDPMGSEPLPQVLRDLQQDPDLIAPVPSVAHTQTMANSGLQVSYTEESLRALAPAALIEQQWVFMQACLEQTNVAPLVLIREGPVLPFTADDDVVRNETLLAMEITSVPIASASTLYGAVIQVSVVDFDGSLGTPAFNLRSILGRHLWLSANLPERDYPFECARQEP